ncbi:MAG: apolipoprotein N-acyltransferase [Spirochaetes bacterium]|nr:apolipoprotein N-acyltransferase [Spirochaetota bacterium]
MKKRVSILQLLAIMIIITVLLEAGLPFLKQLKGLSQGFLFGILYSGILLLYILEAVFFLLRKSARSSFILFYFPEIVFIITLLFFMFSYIFASNANMDYVQRFIASSGKLNLALDTHVERIHSSLQFLPLLAVNFIIMIFLRLRFKILSAEAFGRNPVFGRWAIFWVLASGFLYTVSFPSFISLYGFPYIAWVSLVPLFLVIRFSSFRRAVFYGVSFGIIQTMLTNYWLGTFQLLSLQVVSIFYLIFYLLFMIPAVWMFRIFKGSPLRFLVFPVSWVLFDFLRSSGFLGYPWGMLGVSQYGFSALIQSASITGVWGITFVVILANSVISEIIDVTLFPKVPNQPFSGKKKYLMPGVITFISLFMVSVIGGSVYLAYGSRKNGPANSERVVRVALIQQNSDPRKNDYEDTFRRLVRLTNESMKYKPDLVAWSETAFVPNIRRWSKYDPDKYPLAKLVKQFLAYQKSLNEWLLTGNDDYTLVKEKDSSGKIKTERLDFNASILFSPDGRRVATYHKIRLVPFTESFPYKKQFPFIYNLLINFDVYLWEPGKKRVVFKHPKFKFSTPICFEDAFPQDVRKFVLAGAEVIINISNDYWSLTRIEAKQHFINSIFRTVENRRPLLRSTASGVTAYVDIRGKVIKQAPYYKQAFLIVDVPIKKENTTLYTRYGDWFPYLMLFMVILFSVFALKCIIVRKNG